MALVHYLCSYLAGLWTFWTSLKKADQNQHSYRFSHYFINLGQILENVTGRLISIEAKSAASCFCLFTCLLLLLFCCCCFVVCVSWLVGFLLFIIFSWGFSHTQTPYNKAKCFLQLHIWFIWFISSVASK